MRLEKNWVKLFSSLFCLLAFLLTACQGSQSTSQQSGQGKASANKQIYIYPLAGYTDLLTFDPALAYDNNSVSAISMVFTGLVSIDDKMQIHDQLAASHAVAADGLTWTFKLKPNLKFSDGTPLTSHDVVYSIDRALQPALKSSTAYYYLKLIKDADKLQDGKLKTLINDSLQTPDDQTVVILARQPAAYFLYTLTYACADVVEKSMIDKYGNNFADHLAEGIGGNGPWKVAKYERGKRIEFVPNQNYYGARPQLKKVVMPFYAQKDTLYKDYQVNRVDMAPVPTTQIVQARTLPGKQFHSVPQLWIEYLTMNYKAKPFDNIKIRQAFALAVNKDEIAHNIYKDSVIATNHIVPQGMPGYNPDLTGPTGVKDTRGDPAKARQLFTEGLKEAGYTPSSLPPISLLLASEGSDEVRNEAAALQQMWQTALGVNVKINDVSDGNAFTVIANSAKTNPQSLQMWFADWIADYPDPQDFLSLLFDKGAARNRWNYGDNQSSDIAAQQANQRLMDAADVNANASERLQQYHQIEQQLINEVAWVPKYQQVSNYVLKSCVVGVIDNSFNLIPSDDWSKVYISNDPNCVDSSQYQ
ncbi:peptide ABC transporter substrate-binding protein [Ktedonosporobacter rubrisoli]|uniref:Peptide ABC transporter substrate-binding protein n=1 Tax=Ktedonosporobacter rubrisoli TaxID=2509675 RepID=A0A4P6JLN1_KTERU|nr:peptide ABC transporter substrate-binding protein [Ktedonosporobacter rubrisoli]QBD76114.1 peptide ABC transporter substrate-binding protein [Ktedonosporobacter rubrisoli]